MLRPSLEAFRNQQSANDNLTISVSFSLSLFLFWTVLNHLWRSLLCKRELLSTAISLFNLVKVVSEKQDTFTICAKARTFEQRHGGKYLEPQRTSTPAQVDRPGVIKREIRSQCFQSPRPLGQRCSWPVSPSPLFQSQVAFFPNPPVSSARLEQAGLSHLLSPWRRWSPPWPAWGTHRSFPASFFSPPS